MTWLHSAPRRTAPAPRSARPGWHPEGPLRWAAHDRHGGLLGLVERIDGVYVPMDRAGTVLAPCATLRAAQAAIAASAAGDRPDRAPLFVQLAGLAGVVAVLAAVADAVTRSL